MVSLRRERAALALHRCSTPEKLKVIALIAFGYEVGKASVPPRLPLSVIIHYEAYDAASEPDIITKKSSSGPLSVTGKLLRVLFNKR